MWDLQSGLTHFIKLSDEQTLDKVSVVRFSPPIRKVNVYITVPGPTKVRYFPVDGKCELLFYN